MKSIRAQINWVMFLMLGAAVGFNTLAYQEIQKLEKRQEQVSQSLMMRDKVRDLHQASSDKKFLKTLKKFKKQVEEKERYQAISNLIQAYNSINPKLLRARQLEFESTEKKFFKYSQWQIIKLKRSVRFYLLLGIGLPLLGLCGFIYYINYGVLDPLQSLSRRMMEFLIDQYSFRFTPPKNNEIGDIERTFNSLAQKVLNNIDDLKALDRAKSEFVSIASHELRTPLTSIKGSLGLLSNDIIGSLDKDSKDLVIVAEQETDRLVRLINDLLDLAKIESRSMSLKKEWTPIEEVMNKTAQGLKGFATASQVSIEVHAFDPFCQAHMDVDRIQQVLTNFVSNAIKFSPPRSCVKLTSRLNEKNQLEFQVTDQGPGISEENQKSIFEKFRQATDASNHLVKGTGLGLAISKALVEEHGGFIGVHSVETQGSTFYFTLPEWKKGDIIHSTLEQAA